MMRRLLFGAALMGLAAIWGLPVGAQEVSPDPYQLYARAHTYWSTQQYPALVEYRVAIDVNEGGKERTQRYASAYNAVDGTVGIDPISDYERAHPASGSGVNFNLLFFQVNKPQAPEDFLGVPLLAPAYTFGMGPIPKTPAAHRLSDAELVAQIRAEFHDPNPRTTPIPHVVPSSEPPPIATVVAYKRDYAITLLGREAIDGHTCYHLHLTPTHNPGHYRLRELWLDDRGAPWKLEEALNFTDGPGTDVAWTVHFGDLAGAHYVTEEDANAPMSTSGLIFTTAAVRFEDIHSVEKLDFRPVSNDYLPTNLLREP